MFRSSNGGWNKIGYFGYITCEDTDPDPWKVYFDWKNNNDKTYGKRSKIRF